MSQGVRLRLIARTVSFSWVLVFVGEQAWGQTGACCTCPGICQEAADEAACMALDGVFRDGGTCDPNTCPGVPSNDDCSSPIVISDVPCGQPITFLGISGDNICATDDGPPIDDDPITGDCASSVMGDGEMHADVWYSYTAEYDGTLTVNGCQNNYDQMIAIYDATTGCPVSTGGELVCGDDGCGTVGPTHVTVDTAEGDELLIRVGGWNDEVPGGFTSNPRGDFSLGLTYNVTCIPSTACRWLEQADFTIIVPGGPPLFEAVLKNRYMTLSECSAPVDTYDVQVTLESTLVNGVTAIGSTWWANAPDENCISIVGATRPDTPPDWSSCPTFHLTGCPIIPTSTYTITAMTDSMQASPIQALTQAKPGDKWWGDCVGFFNGTFWTAAQGIVNIDDPVAAIKTFQDPNGFNATHVSITDVHPNLPGTQINRLVGFNDVFWILDGFRGNEYPGPEIELCPDP